MTALPRCPRRTEAHRPHAVRLYFASLGAVVHAKCPGATPEEFLAEEVAAGRVCGLHDRPRPCQECDA